jgi:hypothetical protein
MIVNSAEDLVFFLVTKNYKGQLRSSGHSAKIKFFEALLLLAVIFILIGACGDK